MRISHGRSFEERSRATYLAEKQVQACWSKHKSTFSVTESQLIEYVEYIIDNIFTRIKDIKTENVTR